REKSTAEPPAKPDARALAETQKSTGAILRDLRKKRGLSQRKFWMKVGVPNCGALYEQGKCAMPETVRYLLTLVYGSQQRSLTSLKELRANLTSLNGGRNIDQLSLREIRGKFKLNQAEFWERLMVRQSVGSSYENGKSPTPKHVQLLLMLAYGSDKKALALFHDLRGEK
ncbi:MAG: hypothetical protein LBG61_03025, partial [Burkholderiales bacterium]|nr:hypothetical protein [Burkholderiales bacterium]